MFHKVLSRIQKWPGLFLFHYRRLRFRVKHGKIRILDPLCYLESFHWMQLAKYHQYEAKDVVFDRLPASRVTSELPSISIVTPSYNHAPYLEETIRSVLDQNYPKLTYAVVDGGSADGSAQIIERYKDNLSFSVSEPDKGQSDAIVKGMARLSGEVQAYLNSDDFLAPGVLEYVGSYFAEHPEVDAVYGHRIIVDGNTREIGRWILPPHYAESTKHFDYIPQETMFWRRSIAEKAGGIDPAFHFAMDWDFILRLQASGARFRRLPYFLACFRAHEAQKSQAGSERGKREIDALMKRTGGDLDLGRDYETAHWKFRKKAFLTSVLLSLGIRR
ncbi:MAG: glycosyltransferase family 2 protein [Verrucomicrobiota bacterium]